jgi:ABC-2 type transport system ATP-binding protein
VGYVPETADLVSLSALEFLELCGRLHQIEEQTLQHRIDVLLDGFGCPARRSRLGSYSKGMRQKVLLSSAMLPDPAVLILDEPLTGLDVESAMMTKISRIAGPTRKNDLYSSHVLDVVERFCDRVLIIDHGSIVADGSPDDLSEDSPSLEGVFAT